MAHIEKDSVAIVAQSDIGPGDIPPNQKVFVDFYRKDRRLLLHKTAYTILCAAWTFGIPFIGIILRKHRGFSHSEIGVLLAIQPFSSGFAAPLLTGYADKTGRRHAFLVFMSTLATVCRVLLSAAGDSFLWTAVAIIAYEVSNCPVMPLLDGATFSLLEAIHDHTEDKERGTEYYGRIRLWGAVGWGACALLAGHLVDTLGVEPVMYIIYPCSMILANVLLYRIPTDNKAAGSDSAAAGLRALLTPPVLSFLCVVFIMGIMGGVINSFLFFYLAEMGATATLLGLTLTFTCISEVPFFFIAPQLLQRYGTNAVLFASLIAYGLRLLYYSILENPWWVLIGELLHGITFALGWAASARYANEIAPPELASAAQGLLAGVQYGLGAGTGSLLGGVLYQHAGPRVLFRVASIASLLGMVAMAVSQRIAGRHGRQVDGEGGSGTREGKGSTAVERGGAAVPVEQATGEDPQGGLGKAETPAHTQPLPLKPVIPWPE